jgi:hypothetical protein
VLDALDLVGLFAVELCSLVQSEAVCLQGDVIHPNRKWWDVAILQPMGLLVEVQGEGHSQRGW